METINTMRKLATVRTISDILPIKGADFIELAIVDGWQCVIGKDTFSIGEMVIYCEIDTVLPVQRQYEHLRKSCYVQRDWLPGGEGFRLRTMKLKGRVSQGLLLPLKAAQLLKGQALLGQDVTDAVGIIKWNPPLPKELEGKAKGRYPSYIPKTSQERVQNIIKDVFNAESVTTRLWEVSLKLDGESCTFYHNNNEVGVCSRAVDFLLDQEGNAMVLMFHKLGIEEKLSPYGNIAIQGEIVGPGIHGNRENLTEHQYYAFDIWDIDGQYYLPKEKRDAIITTLGLQQAPVIHPNTTLEELGCTTLYDMLQYVNRPSMNHKVAEGVVFKAVRGTHVVDLLYSFKCINNYYLLGEK